jgi:hypothetical protein
MPFRAPGAGVLSPRPSTTPQQVYYAGAPQYNAMTPPPPQPPLDPWNHQALLAALNATNTSPSGPQSAEWFLDTGTSSHMASNAGIFPNSQPVLHSLPITVGNGASMPVTHRASSSIPTSKSPLLLNNVLVSPSLVKNLISVRALTRDNNVSIEFDPLGFSVKDLPTRSVILRCDNCGELYPLVPAALELHNATVPSLDL